MDKKPKWQAGAEMSKGAMQPEAYKRLKGMFGVEDQKDQVDYSMTPEAEEYFNQAQEARKAGDTETALKLMDRMREVRAGREVKEERSRQMSNQDMYSQSDMGGSLRPSREERPVRNEEPETYDAVQQDDSEFPRQMTDERMAQIEALRKLRNR